jgi:hypothetical protein
MSDRTYRPALDNDVVIEESRTRVFGGEYQSPRQRGRPRAEEPHSSVSTWLPTRYHDRLVQLANHQTEGNVSALVRQLLILKLKP